MHTSIVKIENRKMTLEFFLTSPTRVRVLLSSLNEVGLVKKVIQNQ